MGVKGLWSLLEPSARPVRLEALSQKRLAIDASIWLYQLLKAMKDSDGNPMEEAHVLGFYRRICKLLYYDIRPVFVFDGGAPDLKHSTLSERQTMRNARARDAKRAAHQILQTQLKLHALEQKDGTNNAVSSPPKKRKRYEYELPPLQQHALATRLENEDDLRMANSDDLQQLLKLATQKPESMGGGHLDELEIDVESAAFKALSPEDQHDIIVALKLRSRQTSHGRLQQMLTSSSNALDFSKQQIDLLVKRNSLTQQWLQVTGHTHLATNKSKVTKGRIAAERGREYTLVQNDEGDGWTLRMGGNNQGEASTAKVSETIEVGSDSSGSNGLDEDSDGFEDVPSLSIERTCRDSHHPLPPRTVQISSTNSSTNGANEQQQHDPSTLRITPEDNQHMNGNSFSLGPIAHSVCSNDSYYDEAENEGEDSIEVIPSSDVEDDNYSDVSYLYHQQAMEGRGGTPDTEEVEEQRQRMQQEQELLRLPAQEFVGMWAQLVTRPILHCNPAIVQNMEQWLRDYSAQDLERLIWRTSRQLEKLPDIDLDDDEEEEEVRAGRTAPAIGHIQRSLYYNRAWISCLSLVSNYLSFALRWRQLHLGDGPAKDPEQVLPPVLNDKENDGFGTSSDISVSQTKQQPVVEEDKEPSSLPLAGGHVNGSQNIDDYAENEDEEDISNLDLSKRQQSELMQSEQKEYALFVNKLRRESNDENGSLQATAAAPSAGRQTIQAELESELHALQAHAKTANQNATGVEADMVEDVRMLLTLFGIPYLTAPMEAEAQCAALVDAKLVDGMVTDDSDSFLFASSPSTRVYRHFFQKDKYVEMYAGQLISQDSSLSQRDMVFLTYLLGSDYTVGVKGIGPVLAMEALAEFGPSADDGDGDKSSVLRALHRFKGWCDEVFQVLPGMEIPGTLTGTARRQRLAQVIRKTELPAKFPDPRVAHAYFYPQIDSTATAFEWGFPRIELLRGFLNEKLGWPVDKTNETLVPLVRKMTESKGKPQQPTLDGFFFSSTAMHEDGRGSSEEADPMFLKRSKRVGKAITSHRNKKR